MNKKVKNFQAKLCNDFCNYKPVMWLQLATLAESWIKQYIIGKEN